MSFYFNNAVVIGASGTIGEAILTRLVKDKICPEIYAFSASNVKNKLSNVIYGQIDYESEASIELAAQKASKNQSIDLVFVATGILHKVKTMPEKTFKDLKSENLQKIFYANTIFPAILAKYFLPKMNSKSRSIFAALSARVGSISDNRLGGWYSYRSSKAALNMMIKCLAIEMARKSKTCVIVGLHPGTVDSPLSKPFQANIPKDKLFSPHYASHNLLNVIKALKPSDTGKIFSWDGNEIKP